jgi:hypothetical protein
MKILNITLYTFSFIIVYLTLAYIFNFFPFSSNTPPPGPGPGPGPSPPGPPSPGPSPPSPSPPGPPPPGPSPPGPSPPGPSPPGPSPPAPAAPCKPNTYSSTGKEPCNPCKKCKTVSNWKGCDTTHDSCCSVTADEFAKVSPSIPSMESMPFSKCPADQGSCINAFNTLSKDPIGIKLLNLLSDCKSLKDAGEQACCVYRASEVGLGRNTDVKVTPAVAQMMLNLEIFCIGTTLHFPMCSKQLKKNTYNKTKTFTLY